MRPTRFPTDEGSAKGPVHRECGDAAAIANCSIHFPSPLGKNACGTPALSSCAGTGERPEPVWSKPAAHDGACGWKGRDLPVRDRCNRSYYLEVRPPHSEVIRCPSVRMPPDIFVKSVPPSAELVAFFRARLQLFYIAVNRYLHRCDQGVASLGRCSAYCFTVRTYPPSLLSDRLPVAST